MKVSLLILAILSVVYVQAQNVGIGTTSPGAKLDISSGTSGILIPRVALTTTSSSAPVTAPVTSTMIYNTATAGSGITAVSPGFYYWDGGQWVRLIDFTGVGGTPTVSNTSTANTLTTTVNGVTSTGAPVINTNTVSQNGSNQVISTINGQSSTPADISVAGDVTGTLGSATLSNIQSRPLTLTSLAANNLMQYNGSSWVNSTPASVLATATSHTLTLATNTITSTVNGVAATSAAVSGVSNVSSANNMSTIVNGVTGSAVPIVNSVGNTSSANALTTSVNGVTGGSVSIINSNALSLSGNTLTSAVNGQSSAGQTLSGLTLSGDVTGSLGASTVSKIQGQAVSATVPTPGQVLQYSGGQWAPASAASLFTAGTGLSWSGSTLNSVWTVSGSNIYNNNTTNVGIGQSSPNATLDVNGNIQISNSTIPMGLMTELPGTTNPLLNLDVNFRESNKNNTYRGGAFRIDTRTGGPLFQWITRVAGSATENIQMTMTETGIVGITTLAGTNFRPVFATAAGNLYTFAGSSKVTFTTSGSWSVPAGVTTVLVKLWGAGGGGSPSGFGGSAGFITGLLTIPSGTTTLTIVVGGGGVTNSSTNTTGGGGKGGSNGGSGGGRSAIQFTAGTDIVAAGGGGGASKGNYGYSGGAGGGNIGMTGGGSSSSAGGTGGTQSAPGASGGCATVGSGFSGGNGCTGSFAGGGGGGWFGGGGGGNGSGNDGAGGGGSSGGNTTYFSFIRGEAGQMCISNAQVFATFMPGGSGDNDYAAGVGTAGAALGGSSTNTGGNGYVVIQY